MSDVRIKDLATTTTSPASDDYVALDGATNGTRKILADKITEPLETSVGTLSNLTTTVQSDLVSAINEVDANCDTNATSIGTLSNLTTTDKTDLVSAINEVDGHADTNATAITALQTAVATAQAQALGAYATDTANGEVVSITDGANGIPMKSCVVEINAVQDTSGGDPSPNNVCPISGFSTVNVNVTGINVWDEVWEAGSIDASGNNAIASGRIRSKNYIPIVPSKTYYYAGTASWYHICFYDGSKQFISDDSLNVNVTFTAPSNAHYVRFNTSGNYGETYNNNISINYPSTDTTYHAYTGTTYTTALSDTIYGGTVDVVSGEETVTYGVLDLSTVTFTTTSNRAIINNFATTYGAALPASSYVTGGYIAEEYTEATASGSLFLGLFAVLRTGDMYFYYDGENLPTGLLLYPLATPTTATVTGQDVPTLYGNNTIYADSGDVSVTYRADTALYIDKKLAE